MDYNIEIKAFKDLCISLEDHKVKGYYLKLFDQHILGKLAAFMKLYKISQKCQERQR
ncbi:MAG: hypothetical protein ABI045_05525 [Flavobacteriales bacterium]